MSRFFTGLSSVALLLLGAATLWAQQPGDAPPPEAKMWITSYFIVLLCVALGAILFLRPGTREEPKI